MDVARTCMSMFAHLAAKGYCERALHAGVLAHINRYAPLSTPARGNLLSFNGLLGFAFVLLVRGDQTLSGPTCHHRQRDDTSLSRHA